MSHHRKKYLNVLLPKYAETLVYSAVLEGKASEFGARMTAMGNATKNATKMIAGLRLRTTVRGKRQSHKKSRKSSAERTHSNNDMIRRLTESEIVKAY